MVKVVKFGSKQRKPAAGQHARRKVGRDVFAVLVIGLGVGLSLAWSGLGTTHAIALFENAADRAGTLVLDLTSRIPEDQDAFPVSSIGKTPSVRDSRATQESRGRHYPLCSLSVATRTHCVIDGDTFYFGGTPVRIADIDAPETHPPRCAREADLGDRATRRLAQLLSAGPFQLVRADRDLDRYGRQLRVVLRDGRSIGKALVAEGLARPWTGRRRPWCDRPEPVG